MSKGLFHTLGVAAPFDPEHSLVTSPVFSPLVLAIIRLAFALYILVAVLVILIWDATKLHTADAYVHTHGILIHPLKSLFLHLPSSGSSRTSLRCPT